MNQYTVIGILAHVDAGKTTLSEALLFQAGVIRKQGRVDHKDAFLDTNPLERERGITIYSLEIPRPVFHQLKGNCKRRLFSIFIISAAIRSKGVACLTVR